MTRCTFVRHNTRVSVYFTLLVVLTDAAAWPILKISQFSQLKPVFDTINKELDYIYFTIIIRDYSYLLQLPVYMWSKWPIIYIYNSLYKAKSIVEWKINVENISNSSYSMANQNKSSS